MREKTVSGLKIIKTDCTDPYRNLAAEEYLTMNAEEDVMTLFLWQNAGTVVIGRNQNPWRECDVESIKRDGARLARRMSGGGAVYHDMGNLNFTFIARDGLFDIARQTDVILRACGLLGIEAGRAVCLVSRQKRRGGTILPYRAESFQATRTSLRVATTTITER